MRCVLAGVLLVMVAGCAAPGVRAPSRVVRSVPVDSVRALVFTGTARLQLASSATGDYVRIEGPQAAVDAVVVAEEGDRLTIRNASADVEVLVSARGLQSVSMGDAMATIASPSACKIVVSGDARAHLDNVVADMVQIYVDGASRLDVGKLTATTVATNLDGNAAVKSR